MGSRGEAVVQRRLVEQAREASVGRESGGGWKVVVDGSWVGPPIAVSRVML